MINDNTILSSFDDKPTLLEWLKKVEDALKTDTATAVSVENPSANTYVFKITFADDSTISSGNVVFPDSVKDVSIKNGHIIVTSVGGNVEDLGVLNPYANTIVENASTNTTEIGNNVEVGGRLQVSGEASVTGNVAMGGNLGVTGQAVVGGTLQAGSLQVNSNESVGGGLSVEGSLSAKGGIVTAGKVTANDGMEVHGQGYVNGALGVTGNATIGGTITAGGKAIKAVEANPTGEATETLEKVKIGDVAYNVGGGGGGSEYTAGSNIEISESKAISLKSDLTNVNSIRFKSSYYDVTISSDELGKFKIKSQAMTNNLPKIALEPWNPNERKKLNLIFKNYSSAEQTIYFDTSETSEDKYAFLVRGSKVPSVPSVDGNYILKASVSGGAVTYTWELQQ